MTKEEYLQVAASKWEAIEDLQSQESFYEYEKRFDGIMQELNRELLERSISEVPADRRKKKAQTRYGVIHISKSHRFHSGSSGSSVSPYFQELLVYLGQHTCYQQASEVVEKLIGVSTNAMQIQRLTNQYGERVGELLNQSTLAQAVEQEQVTYAQLDGAMLLTREQGWQEGKLGRVFSSQSRYSSASDRGAVHHSEYVAHLGGHQEFEAKMSVVTDKYEHLAERLVFISDGAPWISNWINAAYPSASQILDFYHAKEHLGEFAAVYFANKALASQWTERIGEQLLAEGVEAVINSIKTLSKSSQTTEKQRNSSLNYYQNNAYRMNYPAYLARGWCIGSGAIEAAHRTVSQQRLKLSGQRWTRYGAQCVLNLRVLRMSGRWHELQHIIKHAA